MQKHIRIFFILLTFIYWAFNIPFAQAKSVKNILMLSAYHSSFDSAFKQIDGVRSILPSNEYNLDVEFMDSKRFEDKKTQDLFTNELKNRLDRLPKYDLIITAEDNALDFVINHRDWFRDIPIVFLGVNDLEKGKELAKDPKITGVLESISMSETIDLAKKLFPNIKSVTSISDGASTGKVLAKEFQEAGEKFKDLEIRELSSSEVSWDEFWQKVPEYGKDNAFLLLAIYQDKNQKTQSFNEGVAKLVKIANSPVFYISDNCIDTGIVGGKVISFFEQGKEAALITKHYFETGVLDPVVKDSPNKIILDYNVINKFGINEKNIPRDAIIKNKPVSFVSKYLKWIVSITLVILVQMGLILGLLINRKQRNKALKESWKSEENLRITLESIGDGVIATDINGNITKLNKVAEELTGWKKENAIGAPFEEVFNIVRSRSGEKIKSPVESVIEEKKIIDLESNITLISKTGKKLHIADSGAPIFNDEGGVVGVVLVFRDVTEKELLEKATKENEERMRMFFSSSNYGIYCVEFENPILIDLNAKKRVALAIKKTGRMRFANKRAANLAGFKSEKEIIGHTLPECAFSDEAKQRQEVLLEEFVKNDFTSCAIETTITSVDGFKKNINYKITGIIENNHLVRAWAMMEDVTELRKAEEQFRQAQKMDVVGRLAGGVAHDFNNMLAGILGHAELIEMKIDEESPIKRHVGPIINAATRAADLTNKLLVFSRKGKTDSTLLDIHETIATALGLLERSFDKKISIKTNFAAKNYRVVGDPTLLQNALMNLALNARDAMPKGGTLSFETYNMTLSSEVEEIAYNLPKGEYIEIHVADTGQGMSKEVVSKIFDPFFTTKPVGKGTGLGLSAVYGTIKEHRGSISVYSEVDSGTVFKIYLPVEDTNNLAESLMADVDATLIHGEGLILIVDDESLIRNMAKDILISLGYSVLFAEDSDDAIDIFTKNKDKISLVILDMIMPKKSGKELFEELRKIKPDVKAIVSSGFSRKDDIDDMIREGAKGFVQKPYRQSTLSQAVAKALEN